MRILTGMETCPWCGEEIAPSDATFAEKVNARALHLREKHPLAVPRPRQSW